MYAHKLKLAFAKGMLKTTEAEVGFTPTRRQFDAVLNSLGDTVSSQTLDVSYSILTAKENTSYRVTINDSSHIQSILEEVNTKPDNALVLFKTLVKDPKNTLIRKKRDKRRSKELDDGIVLKISEEVSVTAEERTMLEGLTKAKAKNIGFRLKDRHTRVLLHDNGFLLKVDATIVHTNDTNTNETHEVEIELTTEEDFAKVPKSITEALAFNIQKIRDVIKDAKSLSKSSKSSSSSSTSSSFSTSMPVSESGEVHPKRWTLPNRKGFLDWMYKTYKYKSNDGKDVPPGQVSLFPHQKIVRDYMHISSPYRGVLLYHGLGVGKSLASIAAAEGFVKNRKRVIVMVPASLETNYREEIIKSTTLGNPSQKSWVLLNVNPTTALMLHEYLHIHPDFVKKSWKVWVPSTLLAALPTGHEIDIVKNKENVAWSSMSESEQTLAKDTLKHLLDTKYTFLRYNGISKAQFDKLGKDFFNDAFIVIDEAHNFISRVVNGGDLSIPRRIYSAIMDAAESKVVLLTGSPVINHPYELSVLLNLARGPMHVYKLTLTPSKTNDTIALTKEMVASTLDESPYIDQWMLRSQEIHVTFLPHGYVNTVDNNGNTMVKQKTWKKGSKELIKSTFTKLEEDLTKAGFKVKVSKEEAYAFPSKKEDFVANFMDETDRDNPKVINMELFSRRALGLVSYFRSAGQDLFPDVKPRIIESIHLCDTQFSNYVVARDKERSMETKGKKRGLMDAESSVYRAYSRMACNFTFPKHIERVFPSDVRLVMKREVQVVDEDEEKAAAAEQEPVSKPGTVKEKDVQKRYDTTITTAMKALEEDANKYLSVDALRTNYSSKFSKIYEHIETCPGKALLYSQFRVVEGLGILALMLQHQGYAEVKVEQRANAGGWTIANAERVLSPEYNGKRFIVFDGDRDKTQIMLQLFNGAYGLLPQSIQTQLTTAGFDEEAARNLRGSIVKLLMITQSGAEGISLKNVRRVLITEPFWNMVRMDQVVGRAVRTGSHLELPQAERTVEVYIYTSTLTQKQLSENYTLRRQDNSMTSDQHILQKAIKKDALIQEFMNCLKSVAVDCRNNAAENRMTDNGLSCYAFPIPVNPDDYAFTSSFQQDKDALAKDKFVRSRKIRGHVLSRMEKGMKKKYVELDDKPGKLFDYNAYKNAGVLVEV
jgi:hypothetical protein